MPQDALGQGQEVIGFVSKVPGIETVRSRNACATKGAVAVLQRDHVVLLPSMERIDLSRSPSRRFLSTVTDVADLRRAGELFATPTGFLVGFRGRRGFFLDVNLETRSATWVTAASPLNVVGVLKGRDGEAIVLTESWALLPFTKGPTENWSGGPVTGVARGLVPVKEGDRPVVRHVTVAAANAGETQGVAVNSASQSATSPTNSADTIIGTSTWSASAKLVSRSTRSRRHGFNVRDSDPTLEVKVSGAGRRLNASVDVELTGQGRRRRDGGG